MEPGEGSGRERGGTGQEGRAADIGRDGIGHNLLTPGVFQTTDAHNGILEAPWERNVSFGMAARHLEPAEVTLGDLALLGLVVGRVWDTRVDAATDQPLKKKTKG